MATTKTPVDLAAFRASIATLQAERQGLQASTRDQNDARAENAAFAAAALASFTQRMEYAVAAGDLSNVFALWPRPDGKVDLGPLLATIVGPDALAAALNRHIDALPSDSTRADRAARLAEIEAELDDLEDAEEVAVCRLEAQGLQVDRRASARPEIVLKVRG